MSVEMNIDDKQFQATLRQYLAVTSKDLPDALNAKMFFIALGAHHGSPKADRSEIESSLGVTAYRVSISKKTGKFKRRKAIIGGPVRMVYAIINARRGRAGKPGLYGKDMAKAAARMLARRFRGVGTVKWGWVPAIRAFGTASGNPPISERYPSWLKGRGSSVIAKDGWSPSCELNYEINSYDTKHNQSIDPRTVAALQKAFDDEARSMREYLSKKLQARANQFNGRP